MENINIGIIGSGFIVPVFVEVSRLFEEYHLRAIWGRHMEKLEKFRDAVDYCTCDLDEMLNDEKIDAIYVAVPNSLHYIYARKALEHGKHVICEKPFTVYAAQAEKLIRLAKKKGLILFEAIPTAYNPYYRKAVEKVKELGDIRLAVCNFSQYSRRYDRFRKGEILPAFDKDLAGGALLDLNVYNIRFLSGIFGMPKNVVYHANVEKGVDTSGTVVLDYGKFKAVAIAAKDCKAESYGLIEGDAGYLRCNTTTSRCADFLLKFNKGEEEHFFQEKQGEFDSWKYEMAEFISLYQKKDLARAQELNRLTLVECRIIEQAIRSAGLNYPEVTE